MRASIKTGDKWEHEELPADPQALSDWLWKHDGQQAVVADDTAQVFYCGREAEYQLYKKKGKKVAMFYDLEKMLRDKMPAIMKAYQQVEDVFPGSLFESYSEAPADQPKT